MNLLRLTALASVSTLLGVDGAGLGRLIPKVRAETKKSQSLGDDALVSKPKGLPEGWTPVPNPGAGHCLLYSLGVPKPKIDSVRQKIVKNADMLKDVHGELFGSMLADELKHAAEAGIGMKSVGPRGYLNESALPVLAALLKCRISVWNTYSATWGHYNPPVPSESPEKFVVFANNHYEALVPDVPAISAL